MKFQNTIYLLTSIDIFNVETLRNDIKKTNEGSMYVEVLVSCISHIISTEINHWKAYVIHLTIWKKTQTHRKIIRNGILFHNVLLFVFF